MEQQFLVKNFDDDYYVGEDELWEVVHDFIEESVNKCY